MTMKFSQFPKKATTAQNFEVAGLQDGQNALLDLTELDNKAAAGIEQAGVALSTANQAQLDATEALDLIAQGGVGGGNALVNSTPTIEGNTTQYIRAMRIEYPLNAYGGGLMYMQFGAKARAQLVFTYNDSGAIEFRLELVRGVSSTGLPFKGGVLISEIQPGQWDVFFKRVSGNSAVKVAYWSDVAVQTSGITVEHFAEAWTATAPMGVSIVDVYSWIGDDGRLCIDKDIVLPQLETDKLTYIDGSGRLKASSLTKTVAEGLDGRLTTTEGKVTALETNSATKTELNNGLATKETKIPTGTAGQFYAHDKTWKTPPQPNLSGYATTTDLNNGLATKEPTVNAGTVSQFWNGLKQWVAVKLSDIAPTTANRILQTNASGKVVAGSIDPINIARTNVSNSFTAKQTFDASANFSSLDADEILALDASKNVMGSGVTRARLGSLTAGNWQSSTLSIQSTNEYCKILTITMSNSSSSTNWTNYQIAINRNYYGSQSFLNGVLHISAGSQSGGTGSVVYKASFIGQKSASRVFYRVVPDANGILRICEIWTRQTQGAYRNAQCQVSVLGKHPSHTVEIHQMPAQVTDPGDLIEITGIWTNATNAYVSNDLTIGGLAGNAGYIPTLDANGKLIKGASNGTSVVAGELQLHDLASHTRVPYIDANKLVKLSNVTPTELNHLSGITSNVQAQLDDCVLKDTEFSFYHNAPAGRFRRIATVGDLSGSGSLILSIHRGRWANEQATAGFLFINFGSGARVVTAHFLGVKPKTATRFWIVKDDDANNVRLYSETGLDDGRWRYGVISKAPELNISLNTSASTSQFISESANELTGKTEIPFLSMFGSDVYASNIKADTIETTGGAKFGGYVEVGNLKSTGDYINIMSKLYFAGGASIIDSSKISNFEIDSPSKNITAKNIYCEIVSSTGFISTPVVEATNYMSTPGCRAGEYRTTFDTTPVSGTVNVNGKSLILINGVTTITGGVAGQELTVATAEINSPQSVRWSIINDPSAATGSDSVQTCKCIRLICIGINQWRRVQ